MPEAQTSLARHRARRGPSARQVQGYRGSVTRWLLDGNNIMGAIFHGWWNDRVGSQRRLASMVGLWARSHDDPVELFFDGPLDGEAVANSGGNLSVTFAQSFERDAADHLIVARAEEVLADPDAVPAIVAVTADRGLIARLPPGIATAGPVSFAADHLGWERERPRRVSRRRPVI